MFKNIAGKLPFLFHIDNDNIVDRAIHGNYDDKMIFPDVGGGGSLPALGGVTAIIIQLLKLCRESH